MKNWLHDMKGVFTDDSIFWLIKPVVAVVWTLMCVCISVNDGLKKLWKN